MHLNNWESIAISTALFGLNALISDNSKLTEQQKADVQQGLLIMQRIQQDFAQ